MCFSNLSSESRVIPSYFSSTQEVSVTSLVVIFSVFLLLGKILDFPGLAFVWLSSNHFDNLKANNCNSDITARMFYSQAMELNGQHNLQCLNLRIHKLSQLSQY